MIIRKVNVWILPIVTLVDSVNTHRFGWLLSEISWKKQASPVRMGFEIHLEFKRSSEMQMFREVLSEGTIDETPVKRFQIYDKTPIINCLVLLWLLLWSRKDDDRTLQDPPSDLVQAGVGPG